MTSYRDYSANNQFSQPSVLHQDLAGDTILQLWYQLIHSSRRWHPGGDGQMSMIRGKLVRINRTSKKNLKPRYVAIGGAIEGCDA